MHYMKKNKYISVYLKTILILLIVIFFIANFVYPIYYSNYVEKYAEEFSVDKYLIYSIIMAESGHDKNAVSAKGAVGLMQIMESTASEIMQKLKLNADITDLKDPKTNIRIGTYYVKYLLDLYDNDLDKAIAAYNAGMNNVDRWVSESGSDNFIDSIDIKETRDYLNRVKGNYTIYEFLYGQLKLGFISLPDSFVNIKTFGRGILRKLKGWVIQFF